MRLPPVAVALLVTFAGAACGGDGPTRERVSAGELRTRANAICAAAYTAGQTTVTDESQLGASVGRVREALADALERLELLEPPAALGRRYEAWLSITRELVQRLEDLEHAAGGGDDAKLQDAVLKASRAGARSTGLARQLGLGLCTGTETPAPVSTPPPG